MVRVGPLEQLLIDYLYITYGSILREVVVRVGPLEQLLLCLIESAFTLKVNIFVSFCNRSYPKTNNYIFLLDMPVSL